MNLDRKLLATIRVYEFENPMGSRSRQTGDREYRVELAPQKDQEHFMMGGVSDFRDAQQTALAHELGHVVAMITQDPTHKPGIGFMARAFGRNDLLFNAEEKAWEIGRSIYPELNGDIEKRALETSKRGGL